ncbi:hypothetical protein E6O75_ATG00678 [Venturia nashicola]|uniref:Uncharacterized protein n=1 Tax=Venturia nashicola TaxID=86259 RepID=A0A4Z1PEI3_9PEZI|nr:hypothetical protein E6O75_ATG00678 [Venturia nashicola]
MKKLDTIRSREMWDFKKEKEDLAKRVSDRDIDVYEQVNIIEELQGKLKVYETEREGRPPGENANTSGTNAPEQSQPILNEEIATATIQADSPSQAEPFSGKESPDDHVADAAETAPQLPTRMGVRSLTS